MQYSNPVVCLTILPPHTIISTMSYYSASRRMSGLVNLLLTGLGAAFSLAAQVSLLPSVPSPQPVGTAVLWKATANGLTGTPLYRFSTRPAGSTAWNVIRDYSPATTLPWSVLQEGSYDISVQVESGSKKFQTVSSFQFISRVTAGVPVVASTHNPLVALYSAPPCTTGMVSVVFWPTVGGTPKQTTPAQSCQPGLSLNFYVAGMLPTTKTLAPPNSQTSTLEDIMLMSFKALHHVAPFYPPTAFDLFGRVLWYYWNPESPKTPQDGYLLRPVAGGTMLIFEDPYNALREVDMAGNVVRETNNQPINAQLKALGQDTITCLSHEALRLPNGHTLTIGSLKKTLNNVRGPDQWMY